MKRHLTSTARRLALTISIALALALVSAPTGAQAPTGKPAEDVSPKDWVLDKLRNSTRTGEGVKGVKLVMSMHFRQRDLDGDGISASDNDLADRMARAQGVAIGLGQWAKFDLDGDRIVTRAEVERGAKAEILRMRFGGSDPRVQASINRTIADAVARHMEADGNGDGQITLEEAATHAEKPGLFNRVAEPLPGGFDLDKDGTITQAEYDRMVDEVIGGIDTNANGIFDGEELTGIANAVGRAAAAVWNKTREELKARERAELKAQCSAPEPIKDARLVLVGAYEGKGVSNVSIGGDDQEVSVAHLQIEEGSEPLEIYVTISDASILHVTGARERVKRLVATSRQGAGARKVPRIGVVGLPKERVAFLAKSDCLPDFSNGSEASSAGVVGSLTELVGKAPDVTIGVYGIGKLSLPSGHNDGAAQLPKRRILPVASEGQAKWKEMLRFAPAGLANFTADEVVAPLHVAPYAVLPQEAGMAQLMDEGAIVAVGRNTVRQYGGTTVVGDAKVIGMEPDAIYFEPRGLRIVKKITMPAGLNGAHSAAFVLGKGVPVPDGDPGHSCVISEETGKLVLGHSGSRCQR